MTTSFTDPATLDSPKAVSEALALLETLETDLDASLAAIIEDEAPITHLRDTIASLESPVGTVKNRAGDLAGDLNKSSEVANRISVNVRQLDLEQSRIKQSIDMLLAVQSLKTSINSLARAFENKDWETAAIHAQKAMSLDDEIVASAYAEAIVPTSDLPLPPPQTLDQFRSDMLEIFLREFQSASTERNEAETSRYFKLFPMIGHEEEGLNAYADFITTFVANRKRITPANVNTVFFPSMLSPLFDQIANIVSQHQPLVDKYYGTGKMLRVGERLQNECDRQACMILRQWEEERIPVKLVSRIQNMKVADYQKFQRGSAYDENAMLSNFDEDSSTAKELDMLLNEVSQMSARWHMYSRFMYAHLKDPRLLSDFDENSSDEKQKSRKKGGDESLEEMVEKKGSLDEDEPLEFIEKSNFKQELEEELRRTFVPGEIWYIRHSIERAHHIDEPELSVKPWLSSCLDDVFFILKKSITRLINVSHATTLALVMKSILPIMEKEFAQVLLMKIDYAYHPSSKAQLRREERDREARIVSIVNLNNIDRASQYVLQLVEEILSGEMLSRCFFREQELESAKKSISILRNQSNRFRAILENAIEQVFNQLLKPRIRPILIESYRDVSYVLDEQGYADAEYQDIFRKRFFRLWNDLVGEYHESMTETNYRKLFTQCVGVLVRPWENIIKNMKFTELGALRFDKDVRSITAFLSSQAPFAAGVLMESFARLSQISTILSLDPTEEDVEEFLTSPGWKLSRNEVASLLECRL